MVRTVEELIHMYKNGQGQYKGPDKNTIGKLYTDQSTQRAYLYGEQTITDEHENTVTRAAAVLISILEYHEQLPAIYFWQYPDSNPDVYHLHDGKQRFFSIFDFINNKYSIVLNGIDTKFNDLSVADQDRLYNYTFDIVIRVGTKEEEQQSFFRINKYVLPLTDYECLHGSYYGTFITRFESFLESKVRTLNHIKKIGRGEQAIHFLYLALGLEAVSPKLILPRAQQKLSDVRDDRPNFVGSSLDKCLNLYDKWCEKMKKLDSHKRPLDHLRVCKYLVDHGYDELKMTVPDPVVSGKTSEISVLDYFFDEAKKCDFGDMSGWSYDTWIVAFKRICVDHILVDFYRNFNNDVKSQLADTYGMVCQECHKQFTFNDLEVDHVEAWSKGGRTDISNAQLLCKAHNASKNDT